MTEPKLISTEDKKAVLDANLLASCIHCGLCLPACPTYLATGREMESPRGRIYLINQWQKDGGELSDRAASHIESCLGCLGCQTACPSGVQYEEILNQTRPYLREKRSKLATAIMRFSFQHILPRARLLRLLGNLLRAWQLLFGGSVLRQWLGDRSQAGGLVARLADWEIFTPKVPMQIDLPSRAVPKQSGINGKHAQLFSGCVMDVFYNDVNHASLRLMLKQGHSVERPSQTCCGALAYHAGEVDIAQSLAKENIDLFGYTTTPIVVTSAGCGAMLKHYGHLLEDDRDYADRALQFSKRIQDVTEFLFQHQFSQKPQPLTEKTTYHAACHLAHAQNVRKEPEALLHSLNSQEGQNQLVPLIEQEHCCGSAGIYNLLNTKLSLKVLDRKLDHLEKTGAKQVVTTNPGCMLQLAAGIKERGLNVEVRHLVDVLDEAYSKASE